MRCNKVSQNPCKICFGAVTKKTGLQCKGACRSWAHFKCLNYTPGKIQDIKAGIIKVMCACPDCDTSEPKEILAIPPILCSHINCPAHSQYCESKECPVKTNAIPSIECDSDNSCPVCLSQPNDRNRSRLSDRKGESTTVPFDSSQSPSSADPKQYRQEWILVGSSTCPSTHDGCCMPSIGPNQSRSYSNFARNKKASEQQNMRKILSDSQVSGVGNGEDPKVLRTAIQNLCNTVCELSTQLKYLMLKLENRNN